MNRSFPGGQSVLDTAISPMVYFYMGYKVKLLPPAVQFLDSLHDRLKAKAARSIRLLQEFGPSLREPHSKKVSDWSGLFELRVMLGHDACRFFYFWHQEHLYVVTSGYIKKGMKLDRRELERAALLMRQYAKGTRGTI